MTVLMSYFAFLILCFCSLFSLGATSVPSPLRDWQDWVLRGEESRACPLREGRAGTERDDFRCLYYGTVRLTQKAEYWEFSQTVVLHRADFVTLPGDEGAWPMLRSAAAVVLRNGRPMVYLPSGTHQLEGTIVLTNATHLSLPHAVASVEVNPDGSARFYPVPLGGTVSLQEAPEQATRLEGFRKIQVYRKIQDQIPMLDETELRIQAAGAQGRVNFGKVVLEGFTVLSLQSPLPATINKQGELEVQLRPGDYRLKIFSRGPGALAEIKGPDASDAWPEDEVWSFEANPSLRIVTAGGLPAIDPKQAQVPEEWPPLPAFLYKKGQSLTLAEQSRGRPDQDSQLTLQRKAWLDFSGQRITVSDQLTGQLFSRNRLDLHAPLSLQYAAIGGDAQVLSAGAVEGSRGLELRQHQVDLMALSESPFLRRLPASGWSQEIRSEEFTLFLPPGFAGLHANGAERSSGTWTSRWDLWNVFILCFAFALIFKLHGWKVLALGFLPLIWFYPDHPGIAFFLIALLLAQFAERLATEAFKPRLRPVTALFSLALVLFILPFLALEIRYLLHPQLKGSWMASAPTANYEGQQSQVGEGGAAPEHAAAPPEPLLGAASADLQRVDRAAAIYAQKLPDSAFTDAKQEQERPSVSIAAGPGVPEWTGEQIFMQWNGPVAADKKIFLLILNRWQKALATLLGLFLLGFFLRFVLSVRNVRERLHELRDFWARKTVLPLLFLGFLAAPSPGEAADYPTPDLLKDLKERLIAAPPCAPQCVTINEARIKVTDSELQIELNLQAQHPSAFPLPKVNGARILSVTADDKASGSSNEEDAAISFVPSGRSMVSLRGPLLSRERISLIFPFRPMRFRFEPGPWQLEGNTLGEGRVELVRTGPEAGMNAVSNVQGMALINREITFGESWQVTTNVDRSLWGQGPLDFTIDLIPGESLAEESPGAEIRDGKIRVRMESGRDNFQFRTLVPVSPGGLKLQNSVADHAVTWVIVPSALWQVGFEGTPLIASDLNRWTFQPREGESLDLQIERPRFVEGDAIAFDRVELNLTQGEAQLEGSMTLNFRNTRGLDHVIRLPEDWRAKELLINSLNTPIGSQSRDLMLQLPPGKGQVLLKFSVQKALSPLLRLELPDLKAMAANIGIDLEASQERWILWTSGGLVSPVVLYWNAFVIFAIIAFVLSRLHFTILSFWQWLLLGWGLASISWSILILFAIWMGILQLRHRRGQALTPYVRLEQFVYLTLTLFTLLALVGSVAHGLLAAPDMAVVGNASYGHKLRWFFDRFDARDKPFVLSLPIWVYKLTMLLWAIWLAFSILEWIRYAWAGISKVSLNFVPKKTEGK